MDALTVRIRQTSPDDPGLAELFGRHLSFARATSPACSVHSKEADDLVAAGARLFVADEGGAPVAMGALVQIGPRHGELKSMHVAESARGRGLGALILERLLSEAREVGWTRLSLETGSQSAFAPARKLYSRSGFEVTTAFADYTDDPNSVYMTIEL